MLSVPCSVTAGSNLSVCCRHDACKIWFEIDGISDRVVANP
jgi:hypothetical protein